MNVIVNGHQYRDVTTATQSDRGEVLKAPVQQLPDGTYAVTYTPEDVGHYTISVKYGGQEVANGPFHVTTVPSGNASVVRPVSESLTSIHSIVYSCSFTPRKQLAADLAK